MTFRTSAQTAATAEDEAAIHDLFRQLIESWNRGDSQAYEEPFTDDADYVAYNGLHLKGRAKGLPRSTGSSLQHF